jgi:osmotically-inducible protein OsmY
MKSNEDLQRDVQEAIKWEPLLKAAEIGVTAKEGIVTLTGTVDSYFKKSEAEDAAKNVTGVKAVVEKITVSFGVGFGKREDNEIAREILNAYKWNWEIPNDKIKVKVEKGWVTLEGELEWNYQREAAVNAVKNLDGVTGVSNNMKIKSDINDIIEKKDIESALRRNWSIDDKSIRVNVHGSNVTLDGTVDSWYEKDEASRIAWNAPGVSAVANNLVIDYN